MDCQFAAHATDETSVVPVRRPLGGGGSAGQFHRKSFLVAVFVDARPELVVNGMQKTEKARAS